MKKYVTLISMMIVATCAFGTAPTLYIPGVDIQQNDAMTPAFDLNDYSLDRDGDSLAFTGPVALGSSLLTVSKDATGAVNISETGQVVGYTEDYQFTAADAGDSDSEVLHITVVSGASELNPDPVIGWDFDTDEEGWTGADVPWGTAATFGRDPGEKAMTITQAGNSGEKYVSMLQDYCPPDLGESVVVDGKLYELTVNLKGNVVANQMPKIRYLASGQGVKTSNETILVQSKADTSPGSSGGTYKVSFIPHLGGAATDLCFTRIDVINFPGVAGYTTGQKILYAQDVQVDDKGAVPATGTLVEKAHYTFAGGPEGWTTDTLAPLRNWGAGGTFRPAGTAAFLAVGDGKYNVQTTVATDAGVVAMIQSPRLASDTIAKDTDYLVTVKMTGSNTYTEMPKIRCLMANDDINVSNEFILIEMKVSSPDNTGSKEYKFVGRMASDPVLPGTGAFLRIDVIAVGYTGDLIGTRSIDVEDVAIYALP